MSANNDNFRSRKWVIEINNPMEPNRDKNGNITDEPYTHERIKNILNKSFKLVYWCMCDEIGENQTYHTHVFLASANAIRFNTLKEHFPTPHLEPAKATAKINRDYIRKEGKWEKDKKKETNIPETFEEFGEIPLERQGQRNDLHDLLDMIKAGNTDNEIVEANPNYMFQLDKIDKVRQMLRKEKFKNEFRILDITYLYGTTRVGKTRSVMDKYGYTNVYRVTDYKHPFDNYEGEDVLVFDEFFSSEIRIGDMNNYLDGYPILLPSRYLNKVACYTKVYIISNIPIEAQYSGMQHKHPTAYEAFRARITTVQIMDGEIPHEWRK